MMATNEIVTPPSNDKYRSGYDLIFNPKKEEEPSEVELLLNRPFKVNRVSTREAFERLIGIFRKSRKNVR